MQYQPDHEVVGFCALSDFEEGVITIWRLKRALILFVIAGLLSTVGCGSDGWASSDSSSCGGGTNRANPGVSDNPGVCDTRTCKASHYGGPGDKGLNTNTASGEVFNWKDMTAAHRKLPFGSEVSVTNPANDKSVTVTINDRGPARRLADRCIDLTTAAFAKIANPSSGVISIKFQVLSVGGG